MPSPTPARALRVAAAALLLTLGLSAQALAAPSASLDVAFAPASPAPPVLGLSYAYALDVANDGDVPLDSLVVIDTLPVELDVLRVSTGRYTGLTDFAAGEGVRVSYEKNTALGVFTLWGSSPNTTTDTNLTAPPPGLGAGEYVTRVRWEFGTAAAGMAATTRAAVTGTVRNPDNSGGPVGVGDSIQNCAALTAVHLAGPTNVNDLDCLQFGLIAGPDVAIQAPDSTPLGVSTEATATLSGGAPTGDLTFRAFAANDAACATPLLEEDVAVAGAGPYAGPSFPAAAAGGYKWVASYGGDGLHAADDSGCNDPAGAFAVVAPPTASASFGAAAIDVGQSTPLTFTITNPSANTVPLSGVALANTLPAGLAVASPAGVNGSCGSGTITALSQSVTLAGGTIAVGSSCSFSVDVTATAAGALTTTTGAVESANGGAGSTATASLTVRERAMPPAEPRTAAPAGPQTAQELALACSPTRLALLSVADAGRRVRFAGVADAADAGQRVVITTTGSRTAVARAIVNPDGSFSAAGPRPRGRAAHRTRYVAALGERRSSAIRLVRRLRARLTSSSTTVTITGRVTPPLDKPVRRVVITRLTSCADGDEVVARVRPGARGRFRVTLPRDGAGPALYRAETRVRSKVGGVLRTFSLVAPI
ncbi:MAG TPA: hypothetical protein VNO82_19475 [Solirubrobacteraceae bacterium]|nr:hypothetical protein [Solirubrobacteraceae bacterium]